MTITTQSVEVKYEVTDPLQQDILWRLYDKAFTEDNEESPCRQSYLESEFKRVLGDTDVIKFTITDDLRELVGLGMMTNNLDKVPWISQPFYRKRFSAVYERKGIWYVKSLSVSTDARNQIRYGPALLKAMIDHIPKGDMGCFDYSEKMNRRMPVLVAHLFGAETATEGQVNDSQVYFSFVKG